MENQLKELIEYSVNGIDPEYLTLNNLRLFSNIVKKDVKRYMWHDIYVRSNYDTLFHDVYTRRIDRIKSEIDEIIKSSQENQNTEHITMLRRQVESMSMYTPTKVNKKK